MTVVGTAGCDKTRLSVEAARAAADAFPVGYPGLLGGPPLIGLLAGGIGLPAAPATVSVLAAVATGLSLYATPQRALLHARATSRQYESCSTACLPKCTIRLPPCS